MVTPQLLYSSPVPRPTFTFLSNMDLTSVMPLLILRQERNTSIKQWQRFQTDRLIPSRNDLQTVFQHLCCTQGDPSAKFQVHYLQNGKESLPFPTLP